MILKISIEISKHIAFQNHAFCIGGPQKIDCLLEQISKPSKNQKNSKNFKTKHSVREVLQFQTGLEGPGDADFLQDDQFFNKTKVKVKFLRTSYTEWPLLQCGEASRRSSAEAKSAILPRRSPKNRLLKKPIFFKRKVDFLRTS